MFSWGSIRKSSPLIRRFLPNQRVYAHRSFSQSEGTTSPSSSSLRFRSFFNGSSHGKSRPNALLNFSKRSLPSSGVLAFVGSGCFLGYCYSGLEDNSHVSFADSANEATQVSGNDDLVPPEKKKSFLFGDAYRKRVFFNYEKRLRLQGPPEKVFKYFASLKTHSGEDLMTPADLMRAVVPVFPPAESGRVREGFLRGEKPPSELQCDPSPFFMLFDTNGDGLISFPEYIFFVTLLSIPESSFSVAFKMFDLDNNGEIDREEFKKVMSLMRAQDRQGASHRDRQRLGFIIAEPVENDGGLLEYFFGKDGKTCLQHGRFVQFLKDFHHEILRLEFAHYDYRSCGSISAKDFALSLVASADISQINKLLDRVDELGNEPGLRDVRITFQEFKDFAELRKQLQSLSLAIFCYGKVNGVLTKTDFQRASSQVCGVSMTDNLVDIIFYVFDVDRDGSLSSDEFITVLQRKEKESPLTTEAGFMGLMSCCFACAKSCPASKPLL